MPRSRDSEILKISTDLLIKTNTPYEINYKICSFKLNKSKIIIKTKTLAMK